MNTADVWIWSLIITGLLLTFLCHWLAATALFPEAVEGCRRRYGGRPALATLIGLLVVAPLAVIGAVALKAVAGNPLLSGVVTGVLLLPLLLAFLGSAGLALRIGAGLASPVDAVQPWRRVLRGGIVLVVIFLLPLLGWFIILPWTLVSGFGAAVMTLWAAAGPSRIPVAPAPPRDSSHDSSRESPPDAAAVAK